MRARWRRSRGRDRGRRGGVPARGGLGGDHPGRIAHELAQRVADRGRRGEAVGVGVRPGGVDHPVAQVVEGTGDAGLDLAWTQHPAVLLGRRRARRPGHPRPGGGEQEVDQGGEVGDVGGDPSLGKPEQGGLHGHPDHPDPAGVVDQDVLGHEAAVGHAGLVGMGDRRRDLRDDPGGPATPERALLADQDVEGRAAAPLVDDEAEVGPFVDVEDPEDPPVGHRRGVAGGPHQSGGPRVVRVEHVDGDVPVEDAVLGAPESATPALAEQVDQQVAVCEDVTRADQDLPTFPCRRGELPLIVGRVSSSTGIRTARSPCPAPR